MSVASLTTSAGEGRSSRKLIILLCAQPSMNHTTMAAVAAGRAGEPRVDSRALTQPATHGRRARHARSALWSNPGPPRHAPASPGGRRTPPDTRWSS